LLRKQKKKGKKKKSGKKKVGKGDKDAVESEPESEEEEEEAEAEEEEEQEDESIKDKVLQSVTRVFVVVTFFLSTFNKTSAIYKHSWVYWSSRLLT